VPSTLPRRRPSDRNSPTGATNPYHRNLKQSRCCFLHFGE
jgi:hypothetical protein